MSWLSKEFDVQRPRLSKTSISVKSDSIADDTRSSLEIGIARQLTWPSASIAFKEWRSATDNLGVYVFLLPMGENSCRGFSLWNPRAPVIAVNTAWNYQARIFTLFHELGHLITRTDSACKSGGNFALTKHSDHTERWCEKFAAAVLLPWKPVRAYITEYYAWTEGRSISNLDVVYDIASKFKVSARAAALRLIQQKAASWDLYRKIPPISDAKKIARGGHGRVRQEISEENYGLKTAKLLLRGTDERYLTIADTVDYLRIKDTDLDAYREHND